MLRIPLSLKTLPYCHGPNQWSYYPFTKPSIIEHASKPYRRYPNQGFGLCFEPQSLYQTRKCREPLTQSLHMYQITYPPCTTINASQFTYLDKITRILILLKISSHVVIITGSPLAYSIKFFLVLHLELFPMIQTILPHLDSVVLCQPHSRWTSKSCHHLSIPLLTS